jgi:dUTP pyrophosphatase
MIPMKILKQTTIDKPMLVKKTGKDGIKIPAHPGDVGFDLCASEDVIVYPGSYAEIKTSVAVEIPEGYWGLIVAKSGTNRSGKLIVLPGVIDNGYRGKLGVFVHNVSGYNYLYAEQPEDDKTISDHSSSCAVTVSKGQAIAQLVLFPIVLPTCLIFVDELASSERGENGFGSTGQGTFKQPKL